MALGNLSGKARTNPTAPDAFGVCDNCGTWWNRRDLLDQVEYYGNTLKRTGYVVCPECFDVPQDQLRPIILPIPDPVPVINPRTEYFDGDRGQQGFTLYVLQFPPVDPTTPNGKALVLSQVAQLSDVATPNGLSDESGRLAQANLSQQVAAANPNRSFFLLYNPASAPLVVGLGAPASFAGSSGI